jgi:hypothetical protein
MSKLNFKEILELFEGDDLATKIKGLSMLAEVNEQTCKQVPREVVEHVILILKTSEKKPLTISALTTLAHFSKFENLRITISELDGVLAIAPCLNVNDASTVKTAVKVISELANGEKNQTLLVQKGGIVPLIGIIQRDNKDSKKLAINIITEIFTSPASHLLLEENIIQSLFVLMSSPHDDSLQWISKMMYAYVQTKEEIAIRMSEFGLVEYLIALANHNSTIVSNNSFQTLEYITRSVENMKKWAGEFGAIKIYMDALKGGKVENKVVLTLLYNITREGWEDNVEVTEDGDVKHLKVQSVALVDNKAQFLDFDGVKSLLEIVLAPNTSDEIRQLCIDIIGNLSIGTLTLRVLDSQFEKKRLTDMLLDILVDPKNSDKLRNSVIETISSFAKDEDCVKKLVEMEVLSKLLAMLRGKVLILVVVELFARLNQHQSFQKQIFENGGLIPIVEMLDSQDPNEREAGLHAMVPFTQTPNGRIVLQQLGVITKVKNLESDESKTIQQLARMTYKKIFKDGDSAFKLGLNTKTPFKFDYDEISRIDQELVAKCQENIRKKLGKKKMRVQINWRQIERIDKETDKEMAMNLLRNEEVWTELTNAIDLFTFSEETKFTFDSQITLIMVDVQKEANINIDEMMLTYTIPFNGLLWAPKKIAGSISMQLLGRDVTEEMEDIDDKYYHATEEMKRIAKDSSIPTLGDINILYFHLTLNVDKLYKESFVDSQAIIIAKKEVLDPDELFIKGWKLTNLSKKGYKTTKLLLLTNCNLYVVAFDYHGKKVDFSGTTIHPLDDFDSVDIGILKSKNATEEESMMESRQYALCIYETDRETEGETKMKVRESDFKQPKKGLDEDRQKDQEKRKSVLGGLINLTGSFRLKEGEKVPGIAEVEESDDIESSSGGVGEVDDDASRSLLGLEKNIYTVSEDTVRSKQKSLIDEIAWTIWAAAAAFKRRQLEEPHYQDIEKPSEGILSSIYNKLGMGVTSSKNLKQTEEPKAEQKGSRLSLANLKSIGASFKK